MSAWLRAVRPHHWVKNVLLLLPMLLAHEIGRREKWIVLWWAFVGFCLVASAGYVVNDLLDAAADRQHPLKASRPFASGALSRTTGVGLAAGLFAAGLAVAWLGVSPAFTVMTVGYAALALLYSVQIKRVPVLDVLVLAGLYTLRLLAGGVAASTPVSPWLLSFAAYFFLSLATLKRYTELERLTGGDAALAGRRRGYEAGDLALLRVVGPASGYVSVLVLGLYVNSANVVLLYSHPVVLWLLTPLFLYWVTRLWFLANRDRVHDDPLVFAVSDPGSWIVGLLVVATVLAAA